MSERLTPRDLLRQLRDPELLRTLADELERDPDDVDDLLASLGSRLDERPGENPEEPLVLHVDGASRNNPGPAGGGAILRDRDGNELAQGSEYFGADLTNNAAEYRALLLGLDLVPPDTRRLKIRMDSQLITRQLNGQYRVKSDNLQPYYRKVRERLKDFEQVSIRHVPREQNQEADELANRAIDARG